jgi:hypothetical protein
MTSFELSRLLEKELSRHRKKFGGILRTVLVEERCFVIGLRSPQSLEFSSEDARP